MSKRQIILLVAGALFSITTSACGMISGLFATETPVPTNTPLPTSTPTPSPTVTPVPTVVEAAEEPCTLSPFSSLPTEYQTSDTVTHVDEEAGYELAFSETWVLVDMVEGDVDEVLATTVEQFPELESTLETFLNQPGDTGLRLLSLYGDLDFVFGNIFPNLSVVYIADPLITLLPIELLTEQTALSMPTLIPEIEVLGTGFAENAQAVSVGLICSRLDLSGAGHPTFQKQVIAKGPAGLLVFTFVAADDVFAEIEPLFDAVIHTFKVIEPESEDGG